jgi:hypothetical protein
MSEYEQLELVCREQCRIISELQDVVTTLCDGIYFLPANDLLALAKANDRRYNERIFAGGSHTSDD